MALASCDIGGYRMSYAEAGRGEPLILVHGSMSDYRAFAHQMDAFSARFRTVAVSLRHCHPDRWDGVGRGFSVEGHARDLAAFVLALGEGPAHILGHSRGGAVAVVAALARPDLVRSLILADPGALEGLLPASEENQTLAKESEAMFARLVADLASGDREGAARRFVDTMSGPGAWDRRPAEQRQMLLDNIETGPACAARPHLTAAEVARLSMPILFMTGERSPRRYRAIYEGMAAANPRVAPLSVVADAAHAMNRDKPADFNAAVLNFLAKVA